MANETIQRGDPYPLGANLTPRGTNFAVFSRHATSVKLCLFGADQTNPAKEVTLDPHINRTGNVWHILLDDLNGFEAYSYRLDGPNNATTHGLFNPAADLIDPYSKRLLPRALPPLEIYSPLAQLPKPDNFDWENDIPPKHALSDLIIYEMHAGGFTQHESSGVKHPGTFLGIIEKIPYLVDLGVNAIELLPVFEFNPKEFTRCSIHLHQSLGNYWGYSTVNYFSPAACYGVDDVVTEFKQMVKALHKAGIEVILDVVYNHTAEALGPLLSFNGFDKPSYYMVDGEGNYMNFSGCGNTFNCNHPVTRQLIIDSLRYWASEMHVDGFRFDLASVFMRDRHGRPMGVPPVLEAITEDPLLSGLKLIAEPWDAVGMYQVGSFFPVGRRWSEWNGKYRDCIRRFIKGDHMAINEFATRICGSEDLYGDGGTPKNSINFVTCHDGFTLADLVSYNEKHNDVNGEGNRDGTNDNWSWNCGAEGNTDDPTFLARRQRQIRNFLVALMMSRGVPMILMGDEYGHTKGGNNNTWCLPTEHNWLLWDKLEQNKDLYRFFKGLIALRHEYPILRRDAFYMKSDIEWHGSQPQKPEWGQGNPLVAFSIRDHQRGDHLYVAFNATSEPQEFTLPQLPFGRQWTWMVDTNKAPPEDLIVENAPAVNSPTISLGEHSCCILKGAHQ
ncbi:MAG: isoamylase [Chlamydiales bacterium]|nr:isoamylase [Chlamydiales bacterium]